MNAHVESSFIRVAAENKNNTKEKGIGYSPEKISYYDPFPKVNYIHLYSDCLPSVMGMANTFSIDIFITSKLLI